MRRKQKRLLLSAELPSAAPLLLLLLLLTYCLCLGGVWRLVRHAATRGLSVLLLRAFERGFVVAAVCPWARRWAEQV